MHTTPPCVGRHDLFDSTSRIDHALARQLCAACPVIEACEERYEQALAASGLKSEGPEGTWAGRLRVDERRLSRAERSRARRAELKGAVA